MKKICTFTLEGEDYHSDIFKSNLRLAAYLLYDFIYNYDRDGIVPLNINKNIVYNNLHFDGNCVGYYFDSDVFDNGYVNYEPFLIGQYSFGLTIIDETLSEDKLMELASQVFYILKLNYKVTIKMVEYYSKNSDDESNRRSAIGVACGNLGCVAPRKKIACEIKRLLESLESEISTRKLGFSRKKTLSKARYASGMEPLER